MNDISELRQCRDRPKTLEAFTLTPQLNCADEKKLAQGLFQAVVLSGRDSFFPPLWLLIFGDQPFSNQTR